MNYFLQRTMWLKLHINLPGTRNRYINLNHQASGSNVAFLSYLLTSVQTKDIPRSWEKTLATNASYYGTLVKAVHNHGKMVGKNMPLHMTSTNMPLHMTSEYSVSERNLNLIQGIWHDNHNGERIDIVDDMIVLLRDGRTTEGKEIGYMSESNGNGILQLNDARNGTIVWNNPRPTTWTRKEVYQMYAVPPLQQDIDELILLLEGTWHDHKDQDIVFSGDTFQTSNNATGSLVKKDGWIHMGTGKGWKLSKVNLGDEYMNWFDPSDDKRQLHFTKGTLRKLQGVWKDGDGNTTNVFGNRYGADALFDKEDKGNLHGKNKLVWRDGKLCITDEGESWKLK